MCFNFEKRAQRHLVYLRRWWNVNKLFADIRKRHVVFFSFIYFFLFVFFFSETTRVIRGFNFFFLPSEWVVISEKTTTWSTQFFSSLLFHVDQADKSYKILVPVFHSTSWAIKSKSHSLFVDKTLISKKDLPSGISNYGRPKAVLLIFFLTRSSFSLSIVSKNTAIRYEKYLASNLADEKGKKKKRERNLPQWRSLRRSRVRYLS